MAGDGTIQRAIEAAATRVTFAPAREVVLDDPAVVFSDARAADERRARCLRAELAIDLGSGASVHQEVRLQMDDPRFDETGVVLPLRWRATGR
jgi:hypothetical protein